MKKKTETTVCEILLEKACIAKISDNRGLYYAYNTVINFLRENALDIPLKEIDVKWASGVYRVMKSKGLNNSTIRIYFQKIQFAFNVAKYKKLTKADDFIKRNSFEIDRLELPKSKVGTRRDFNLTKEQMTELYNICLERPKSASDLKRKRKIALFVAMYLCNGCNLADLLRLTVPTKRNLNEGVITFVRHKTERKCNTSVKIPITEPLKNIFGVLGKDIYKMPSGSLIFDYLVGLKSESEISGKIGSVLVNLNYHLKRVGEKMNLDFVLSCGAARKSFCSVLNAQAVPYSYIERAMAHSLKITDFYLGEFPVEKCYEWNSLLLDVKTDENQRKTSETLLLNVC